METVRWRRIEELFHAAAARPPGERTAFLAAACAGDEGLRGEVEALLASGATAANFLADAAQETTRDSGAGPARAAVLDLVGRQLGHYRVVSPLGKGGMGQVFVAEDVRLGRRVALKVLPRELHDDHAGTGRFLREARAASALNHPNIVTVYDIGESDAGPFIAMELVAGRNLRALLADRPAIEQSARIVAQVAQALASAHNANIIHRDIKPENIVVRDDGVVKVVDFGLARAPHLTAADAETARGSSLTVAGAVAGTVHYMSPEQSIAAPLNTATDIYSLGVVFYELLTGRRPIEAESALAHIAALASDVVVGPSRHAAAIPLDVDELVLQMLHRDAAVRPAAGAVAERLEPLTQPSASVRPRPPAPHRSGVGREAERHALRTALARVSEGRGRMVLLGGEAGAGKTTLVNDFLAELDIEHPRAIVARGRCSERLAGTGAYLPLFEAIHHLMGQSAALARVVLSVAPDWHDQIIRTSGSQPPAVEASAPAERMKRELLSVLRELGRERPVVLSLEDLHWVDTATVDVLAYLLDRAAELRLLIVGTYRPTEVAAPHPFADLRLDAMTRGICDDVSLHALERADVDRYLAQIFPDHQLPAALGDFVHRRTEGHALFMADLLRFLADRGAIQRRNQAWVLTEPLEAIEDAVPQSVRSMVDRKLERLSEEDRRLLIVGAVQGDEFDVAVVAAAAGWDPADLEEQLEPLERQRGVVRLVGEETLPDGTLTARYRFAHVLYQNELYKSLRPARRAGLSRAVADALTRFHRAHTDRIAAQLALLFEAARDFEKAADQFLAASQRAQRVGAMQEAETLARRGIDALSTRPESIDRDRRELALHVAMAVPTVAVHTHASPTTLAVFGRIQELGSKTGEVQPLFAMLDPRAWSGLSGGDTRNAHAAARECLALAERGTDRAARIVAHFLVAVTGAQLGRFTDACSHHEQIRALYDPRGHHVPLSYLFASDLGIQSLAEHADLLFHMGRFTRAFALSDEAIALAREHGPALTLSTVLLRRVKLLMETDLTEALRTVDAMLTELESLWNQHQLMHRNWGPYYRGWLNAVSGAADDGTAEMQRAISGLRALGFRYYGPTMSAAIANVWLRHGRLEDARRLIDASLEEADTIGELHIVAELLRLRGLASWMLSEGNGEASVREAIAAAREQGSRYWELRATETLCERLIIEGRTDEARVLLARMADVFRGETGPVASLDRVRAILAAR